MALAVVGGGAVLVALGVATLAWSARVGRRHGGWWRLLPVAALVGLAATVLGPLSGVGWMAWGFDQAATADPSDKARVVADAISAGMFAGLAGGGAGATTLLVVLAACVGLELSAPRAVAEPISVD